MKATWRASFLKSCEQANQCNSFGEMEECLPCIFLISKIFENSLTGKAVLPFGRKLKKEIFSKGIRNQPVSEHAAGAAQLS